MCKKTLADSLPLSGPCASPVAYDALSDEQLLKRFAHRREEAAFAVLVRRHGPMVLNLCRRVLEHDQDAEDVFQATFVVLIEKASRLRQPELLANWLYGVASRLAMHVRKRAARRSEHERKVALLLSQPSGTEIKSQELRCILEEELDHLPEKYRAPLVLCYLQGKTNVEAARLLGWPTGSISYRLARGRELLRERLELCYQAS